MTKSVPPVGAVFARSAFARPIPLVLSALALATLTGCSIGSATAGELSGNFASTLAETELLLDSRWEIRDDPVVRACTTSGGIAGTRSPALRIATGTFDGPLITDSVAAAWTAWGYGVTVTELATVSEVQARGLEGEYLIFRVSDAAATLQGESACTPSP